MALGTLWGCASLPVGIVLEAPEVSLEGVRVTGLGISGGTLALDLDVLNPNPFDVRTTRIDIVLDLEETRFGDISIPHGVDLTSGVPVTVEIPMTFTWSGVGAGARGLLEKGSVAYGSVIRLFVNTPIGERSFTIEGSGVVPIEVLLR